MFVRADKRSDNSFGGQRVDRAKPVRFKLNGETMIGLAGDTLYSAALANGYLIAGTREAEPVGVSANLAPDVWVVDGARQKRFNSALLQVRDGGDYWISTQGNEDEPPRSTNRLKARLGRLFSGSDASFGLNLDHPQSLWTRRADTTDLTTTISEEIETDVLVVGGGVSGLKAAVDYAGQGANVLVVEREHAPGGFHLLQGEGWGGLRASEALANLIDDVTNIPLIDVRTGFLVERLLPGSAGAVRLGGSETDRTHVLTIRARRIVLATGNTEMPLPFAGNRSPRVVPTSDAFRLLRDFGLVPGKRIAVATAGNAGISLALRLAEHGVKIEKVIDLRLAPQSRYIDFLKAYGVGTTTGTRVHAVETGKNGIRIEMAPSTEAIPANTTTLEAEALITFGGWQPDLDLWVRAGGAVSWNPGHQQLWPSGRLDGVEFAGLPGKASEGGPRQNEALESPDGCDGIVSFVENRKAPFLSFSRTFVRHEEKEQPRGLAGTVRSLLGRDEDAWHAYNTTDVFDLVSKVRAGEIPAEFIEVQIDEHSHGDLSDYTIDRNAELPVEMCDDRLVENVWRARLGGEAEVFNISSSEGALARGALLFATGEEPDPGAPLGVILSVSDHDAVALVRQKPEQPGTCFARIGERSVACKIVGKEHQNEEKPVGVAEEPAG
ncbi:MAG: FAD-dependent oxidoreductase [Hyphomicrobiaceae bacterium]|nr:FAD-dependent oxidoreductase [Hyphomicrobiaceae bacterium]MCC0025295.1 FAD-dependent oxidoreductase [Hyphomicrobiaceae bacterium]